MWVRCRDEAEIKAPRCTEFLFVVFVAPSPWGEGQSRRASISGAHCAARSATLIFLGANLVLRSLRLPRNDGIHHESPPAPLFQRGEHLVKLLFPDLWPGTGLGCFSITPCIATQIPLNPPLLKGEVCMLHGVIENLGVVHK